MRKVWAVAIALIAVPTLASAQGNTDRGKTVYATYCATCHGNGGAGDGPAAPALNPKPRDLTDKAYMTTRQDDYLLKVIKDGGPAVGKSPLMAPFGGSLKDNDVGDLVAFLRSLAK